MKNKFLLLALFLNTVLVFGQAPSPHIPNQVIIGFSDNSSQADRQAVIDDLGSLLGGADVDPSGAYTIYQEVLIFVAGYPIVVNGQIYPTELDLISNIQTQHAKVDHADFNYSLTTEQYSFNSFLGASGLEAFSPISPACEANYPGGQLEGEEIPVHNTTLRVGILDTGLDPYYPTINQYVAGEANVLTDDADPLAGITVAFGYNPYNPIAGDDNGHGTAVAGIIAGLSDRVDLSSFNLELYIIKCFDDQGNGNLFNLLQAVRIAGMFDLDILNLSWGYTPVPEDETATALSAALHLLGNEENVIIVAGAGNKTQNLDVYPYAPASIESIPNLITVAGTEGEQANCNGELASFSNYGRPADIAAPSASISVPGLDGYWAVNTSGTSFAAPIVTAAIIQAWMVHGDIPEGLNPEGSMHPICEKVLNSSTSVAELIPLGIEGVVNFEAACSTIGVLSLQTSEVQHKAISSKFNKKETGSSSDIKVSPNPFTNQLSVTLGSHDNTAGHLTVTNLQGAVVLQKEGTGTVRLELPNDLPSGPYLLQVTQNGEVSTKMIIKS